MMMVVLAPEKGGEGQTHAFLCRLEKTRDVYAKRPICQVNSRMSYAQSNRTSETLLYLVFFFPFRGEIYF